MELKFGCIAGCMRHDDTSGCYKMRIMENVLAG